MNISLPKPIENTFAKASEYRYNKLATYTRATLALNFGLLCGAQAIALGVNPEVPDKAKKFLIPSEIIEGLVKIGIFFLLGTGFGVIGKKLVEKGVLIPKTIIDSNIPKTFADAAKLVQQIESPACLDSAKIKALKEFKGGVEMVSNVVGMIVGLSLFVPYVRNKIAKVFRDKAFKNLESKNIPITINKAETSVPVDFSKIHTNTFDKFIHQSQK